MTRGSPNKTRRNSITAPTSSSGTARTDGLEERVLAFAEQLGRIAGTVQAKTAGWMDGDTLKIEIARVREQISQPLAGEIRLQWWSDLLAGTAHGEVTANPVAAELLDAIERHALPREKPACLRSWA